MNLNAHLSIKCRYLEHKCICGMCVRTDVCTYVQRNCPTVHAIVGLAQACPNYGELK